MQNNNKKQQFDNGFRIQPTGINKKTLFYKKHRINDKSMVLKWFSHSNQRNNHNNKQKPCV